MTSIFAVKKDLEDLEQFARDHGFTSVNIYIEIHTHRQMSIYYSMYDPITCESLSEWSDGDTSEELIASVRKKILSFPVKEDREREQYLKHLAKTIEYGKKIGIDENFINPLELQMKRLSSNIIEHKPVLTDDIPF